MDLRKIKKLIELLQESALTEMEITEGDNTIRLSRATGQVISAPVQMAPVPQVANAVATLQPGSQAAAADTSKQISGAVVASPMVGTYYDAASPDAEPFVKVGSRVSKGDTLCIVEAMKTFNQIESEFDGVVKAIHKSSGNPVEFGEPLFVIG